MGVLRKVAHAVWVQVIESGAVMTGQAVDLDPTFTGDRFAQSPVIRERWSEHVHAEVTERREHP